MQKRVANLQNNEWMNAKDDNNEGTGVQKAAEGGEGGRHFVDAWVYSVSTHIYYASNI